MELDPTPAGDSAEQRDAAGEQGGEKPATTREDDSDTDEFTVAQPQPIKASDPPDDLAEPATPDEKAEPDEPDDSDEPGDSYEAGDSQEASEDEEPGAPEEPDSPEDTTSD